MLRPRHCAGALLATATLACSCAKEHTAADSRVPTAAGSSAPRVAPAPKPATGRVTFELTQFESLLGRNELARVRLALDEERASDAAAEFSAWLAGQHPDADLAIRYEFMLGRMWLRAGQSDRAEPLLERSCRAEWPLSSDACLSLAQARLALGDASGALAVGSLVRVPSVASEWLLARALVREGKFADANEHFLSARALTDDEDGAVRLDLELERIESARLGLAALPEPERKQRAAVLRRELEVATLGVPPKEQLGERISALSRELQRLGATEPLDLDLEQRVIAARGFVTAGSFEDARRVIQGAGPRKGGATETSCELVYWDARALAGLEEWGRAAEVLGPATDTCTFTEEQHARILFNAGKFAAADGRDMAAARFYERLEEQHPSNSLADDARLRRARCYKDAGVPARFSALLLEMPEVYPTGDMTMEGALELALYRIERSDWAGALQVLELAANVVSGRDAARGHEESGRERYFVARAYGELGDEARELDTYEAIVRELPLSYYMLHAYSRLSRRAPERGERALAAALAAAKEAPFSLPRRPEYETPEFLRGLELFRVGEIESGRKALARLRSDDPSLIMGLALLHDRAGDATVGHSLVRGRTTEWYSHYPGGSWQEPWQLAFPRPYLELVTKESAATNVPAWFIYGVMREESLFDATVVSHANAYGLMQIIPSTARLVGEKSGLPYATTTLRRPSVNIALGARVLESLLKQFPKNPVLAIPGYNAGPGRPIRWLKERPAVDFDVWVELIPLRETRRYTKRVLASRAAYSFLYAEDDSRSALLLPERLEPR